MSNAFVTAALTCKQQSSCHLYYFHVFIPKAIPTCSSSVAELNRTEYGTGRCCPSFQHDNDRQIFVTVLDGSQLLFWIQTKNLTLSSLFTLKLHQTNPQSADTAVTKGLKPLTQYQNRLKVIPTLDNPPFLLEGTNNHSFIPFKVLFFPDSRNDCSTSHELKDSIYTGCCLTQQFTVIQFAALFQSPKTKEAALE